MSQLNSAQWTMWPGHGERHGGVQVEQAVCIWHLFRETQKCGDKFTKMSFQFLFPKVQEQPLSLE